MKPFVRVVGSVVLVGCSAREAPEIARNPPAPEEVPLPDVPPTANPPGPALPTWEEVESGHPEGATNPPMPTLYVARDTGACFKDWLPGMIRPDDDIMAVGGRVYDHAADVAGATQILCPEGQPAELIAAYDAAKADGFK